MKTRRKTQQILGGEIRAENIPVDNLYLDPNNPRLAGKGLSVDDQEEILKILWKERSVNELVDSISANGFWRHEILFAAKEDGKLLVIEGNRRLAAVKVLLDEKARKAVGALDVPTLGSKERRDLATLPVMQCQRDQLWQYVGFKHVNGPQDWDSIAKAEYVARVHDDIGIELDRIAGTIGDRHETVKRMYRGYRVLIQAEDAGQFHREDRYRDQARFAYSHLWTGLGYGGIKAFLGIKPSTEFSKNPVPKSKFGELGELCRWLYGSKENDLEPVIRKQNPDLRHLDEVISDKDGLAALRRGLPLETCLKISRGEARLLREALVSAQQSLREARGWIPTGYEGDSDLLDTARNIKRLADSIQEEMQEIHDSRSASRRRRRTS